MKLKNLLGAIVLFASIALVSCGPNDAKIQKEVSQKLTETSLSVTGLVQKGVVTLEGVVETDAQKAQAETVVKVKGVKSVTNNITVTPPAPKITPDEAFLTLVKQSMTTAGFSSVNLNIVDSIITLTGEVKKGDLKKVMQIANESGAKKVVNELTIVK